MCFSSLPYFSDLAEKSCGVKKIGAFYFFKTEADFQKSGFNHPLAKQFIKKITVDALEYWTLAQKQIARAYNVIVQAEIYLAEVPYYRPYLWQDFLNMGGLFENKHIASFSALYAKHPIILNCSGWLSGKLKMDEGIVPTRGQSEILINMPAGPSCHFPDLGLYIIHRPQNKDCILGASHQEYDEETTARFADSEQLLAMAQHFVPYSPETHSGSLVGIRCGRADVCLDTEHYSRPHGQAGLILHNYGHSGSGFSAAWGCAEHILNTIKASAASQNCTPAI